MTTNTNISTDKKVSAVQKHTEDNLWVIIQEDDGEITTLNANGEEASVVTVGDFLQGGPDPNPSSYEEIKDYRESNPEIADGIGIYHPEYDLITAEDIDGIADEIAAREQQKQEEIKEARQNIDLPEERLNALEQVGAIRDFYQSEDDYIDFAVTYGKLKATLSDDELDEVEKRERMDLYDRYNRNEERYVGLPPEIDVGIVDGAYKVKKEDEDDDLLASFRIDVNAFLTTEEDEVQKYDVTIVPTSPHDKSRRKIIDGSVFNRTTNFKDNVCIGTTTTYEKGDRYLTDLKRLIGHQKAPHKDIADDVGIHGDEFVTPHKTISSEGWIDYKESEYVYDDSDTDGIDERWTIESNSLEYDEDDVQEFIKRVWRTRDPQETLPLIGYIYSSFFKTQIIEKGGAESAFPVLSIIGPAGVGKSKAMEGLYMGIGMSRSAYGIGSSTAPSIRDDIASTQNVPVWFDEYIPTRYDQSKVDQFKQFVKKSVDHKTVQTSSKTHDTKIYPMTAPVIISGEQFISGDSDQRRLIQVEYTEQAIQPEYFDNYESIMGNDIDNKEHAKAMYPFLMQEYEDGFLSRWSRCKLEVENWVDEQGIEDIQALERVGLVAIKFGVELFRELGLEVGVDEDELPTDDDIERAWEHVSKHMGSTNRSTYLDEFVSLIGEAIKANYISSVSDYESNDGSYKLVHADKAKEQLRIDLQEAYAGISKYLNDHGMSDQVELLNPQDYASKIKTKAKEDGSYITDEGAKTPPLGRVMSISTHQAEQDINNFSRAKINPNASTNDSNSVDPEDIPDDL
ncbi:hypothetical protein GOC74_05170 [Halomicrobium mukohataei]|uniref:DUF927 domain-containing protein n=1 Tax=Halomicrobium mukohataei TaxID=57705 RepID=A0A847UE60_9EURY|nr:hypothetical protein [Halomicrobium mukohataei]NLV09321.1 hypothetical protein [Halomicrobium mukohataei]